MCVIYVNSFKNIETIPYIYKNYQHQMSLNRAETGFTVCRDAWLAWVSTTLEPGWYGRAECTIDQTISGAIMVTFTQGHWAQFHRAAKQTNLLSMKFPP